MYCRACQHSVHACHAEQHANGDHTPCQLSTIEAWAVNNLIGPRSTWCQVCHNTKSDGCLLEWYLGLQQEQQQDQQQQNNGGRPLVGSAAIGSCNETELVVPTLLVFAVGTLFGLCFSYCVLGATCKFPSKPTTTPRDYTVDAEEDYDDNDDDDDYENDNKDSNGSNDDDDEVDYEESKDFSGIVT